MIPSYFMTINIELYLLILNFDDPQNRTIPQVAQQNPPPLSKTPPLLFGGPAEVIFLGCLRGGTQAGYKKWPKKFSGVWILKFGIQTLQKRHFFQGRYPPEGPNLPHQNFLENGANPPLTFRPPNLGFFALRGGGFAKQPVVQLFTPPTKMCLRNWHLRDPLFLHPPYNFYPPTILQRHTVPTSAWMQKKEVFRGRKQKKRG